MPGFIPVISTAPNFPSLFYFFYLLLNCLARRWHAWKCRNRRAEAPKWGLQGCKEGSWIIRWQVRKITIISCETLTHVPSACVHNSPLCLRFSEEALSEKKILPQYDEPNQDEVHPNQDTCLDSNFSFFFSHLTDDLLSFFRGSPWMIAAALLVKPRRDLKRSIILMLPGFLPSARIVYYASLSLVSSVIAFLFILYLPSTAA